MCSLISLSKYCNILRYKKPEDARYEETNGNSLGFLSHRVAHHYVTHNICQQTLKAAIHQAQ